jgi:hypothetical protein
MGQQVRYDIPVMERTLGWTLWVFQISAWDPPSNIYNQCDRVSELSITEGDKKPFNISHRRSDYEDIVFGDTECEPEMDYADTGLGTGS